MPTALAYVHFESLTSRLLCLFVIAGCFNLIFRLLGGPWKKQRNGGSEGFWIEVVKGSLVEKSKTPFMHGKSFLAPITRRKA